MRPLSGGKFMFTVGWRIVAFVAVSLAFPYLTAAIQAATRCAGTGGACWVVAALSGTALRLLILVVLVLALLRPVWRRARTVGLPRIVGLAAPLLVLLDWRFLTTLGGYSPVSFARGILNSGFPFFTVLALLMMVVLAVAAPAGEGDRLWRRHGVIGKAGWLVCLAAALLGAVSSGLFLAWLAQIASGGMFSPLAADAVRIGRIANIAAIVAMIFLLWMIAAETVGRASQTAPSAPG